MKVYVDELSKSCGDCFNQHCRIGCKKNCYEPIIKKKYLTSRPKECPLQSLADYTKQVRKEACEEISRKIAMIANRQPNHDIGFDCEDIQISCLEVASILNQIEQGETK